MSIANELCSDVVTSLIAACEEPEKFKPLTYSLEEFRSTLRALDSEARKRRRARRFTDQRRPTSHSVLRAAG